jgi:histidyl-tRNA synthetase
MPLSAPFTMAMVAEWQSFGPQPKGPPSDDADAAARKDRKAKCSDMAKRLAEEFNNSKDWSEKKIAKEMDNLVTELNAGGTDALTVGATIATLEPPSGTRDFPPEEYRIQTWLFDQFHATARSFGFQQYDAPVLEHVELYERKAGEEITGQMYAFTDQEGARVTLRPEMTPTLARMVLNKTNLQTGEVRVPLPLKWYSIPQCWRFETTQRGRKREHYQWNMDIVGVEHVHAELELLAAAVAFFERVGITSADVGIKVNSRAVLEALLAKHGIQKGSKNEKGEDIFAKACVIIDKLDKIGSEAVTGMLGEDVNVKPEAAADILLALEAKSIDELSNQLGTAGKDNAAIQDLKRLFELAVDYGISDYLVLDASVVRGLAYYTGIVWEAFDRRGQLRAIMGGGRYDRLLELYGGAKCQIPCVGFGFGDCVIMELLKECNKLPIVSSGLDYVVCAYSPELYGAASKIAAGLRKSGKSVDLMPTPKKKVANSFKHADVAGAQRMVFVAPSEIEKGVVRVKDLRTKDKHGESIQVDCPLDQLDKLDEMMARAAEAST